MDETNSLADKFDSAVRLRPSPDEADAYPSPNQELQFKAYFEREGFIVVRRALPKELCEGAKQAFLNEVLPAKQAYFMRHASGKHERHVYTEQGFMKYPVMNIQDLPASRFPLFRGRGLHLLTHPTIQNIMRLLFGEPGRMVHTMYFDGNQTTWAHRDGHYLDSRNKGAMVGIWVAAEDIHPDAGRFYVLPRSHHYIVPGEEQDPNGAEYKELMENFARSGTLDRVSPLLMQGDVLLWNSLIVHGSLPTTNPLYARRSFTAHYVPQSHQHDKLKAGRPQSFTVNGVDITGYSEQASFAGRFKNALRLDYPQLYWCAERFKSMFSAQRH